VRHKLRRYSFFVKAKGCSPKVEKLAEFI